MNENREEILLQVENLSKTYEMGSEKIAILNGIDFTLKKREKVTVTGSSGCGKTTFLNLISGLDTPTAGEIKMGGYELSRLGEAQLTAYRRKCIGFVFQFHHLLEDFTASENIWLPAYLAGEPKKAAKERARFLIERVGLSSRADHFPAQLSGGECQRIAVARALINNPPLILADEPTGNLDESHSERVEELLFDVVEKEGKSLILVTHDSRLAEKGDVHYILSQGKLQQR
ncbi:MAG: ABC transporter ATP-binding protein [Spirochaetia bacterium]|nr:ABC transporter ATP-binding protein [Spirochaetia bacterium]